MLHNHNVQIPGQTEIRKSVEFNLQTLNTDKGQTMINKTLLKIHVFRATNIIQQAIIIKDVKSTVGDKVEDGINS